jgi:hypothetical protein
MMFVIVSISHLQWNKLFVFDVPILLLPSTSPGMYQRLYRLIYIAMLQKIVVVDKS